MARPLLSLLAFNRGLISRIGIARVDLKRLALSAQVMVNWMPRVLGSMMLRPGMGFIGQTLSNNAARFLPFIFASNDTALIELTNSTMRVWVNDALVTRASVASAVLNGNFAANLNSWTDNDDAGGTSTWAAPNYMQLTGNGTARAIRDQQVNVGSLDQGIEHALRIVIARGPVMLRVGSTLGGDNYIKETLLQTGTHSLAFTPGATFFIRFFSNRVPVVWVSQCTVEGPGVMQVPTPWTPVDLPNIRSEQSADVLFIACANWQQRRIERRSTTSWSVVLYLPPDGPFLIQNTSTTTISANALTGNITLTSSLPLFRSTHVGALFSLASVGQKVTVSVTAQNTFSAPIRVTGLNSSRAFVINIQGTFVGTVTLQMSIGSATGPFSDVSGAAYGGPVNILYQDSLDNQIIYYRIGIETGNYTSGQADCLLSIGSGSITGVARITGFSSTTSVFAEAVTPMGSNVATTQWAEGSWSDFRGWPTSVAIFEGRLWWSGKQGIWGSISDTYDGFDPAFIGDAGPINRTIGSGPIDVINWLLPLQRLIVGGPSAEFSCRASTLDQPLTPTTFNIRKASTQGSAPVPAVVVDLVGIYVQRGGSRVYQLEFNNSYQNYEYGSVQLTELIPEIGNPGITHIGVQRQPDTRVHFVRSDGTVAVLVFDKSEEVKCWLNVTTNGFIEDVVVLPSANGELDDHVYYVVNRTINGATVRYLEKWAQETECLGNLQLCKTADSFTSYSGGPITNVTGLSHLEGKSVTVWADGLDVGTDDSVSPAVQRYTVVSGQINLPVAASNIVVGLPYTAQFQSTKLGQAVQGIETPLNQQKKVNHLGLVLADTYRNGLKFGPDFSYMDDMPGIEQGTTVADGTALAYDENTIEFPGTWDTDARLCLQAQSPRPCTVLAATIDMEMNR